jgi:hypothetical protein
MLNHLAAQILRAPPFLPRLVPSCLLIAVSALYPALAVAHDQALSGIRVIYRPDDVLVSVSTHLSQLARAEHRELTDAKNNELEHALRKRLHLRFNGKDFVPGDAHLIADKRNDQLIWQVILDKSASNCEVLSRLYPDARDSITVVSFVRDGVTVKDELLTQEHPALVSDSVPGTVAWRYLQNGFHHILSGPDHIIFLLGLLLLGGPIFSLLRTITAFTIAHSLTLALAATGTFIPPGKIIEPLIALSIVAIAIENLRALRTFRRKFSETGACLIHPERDLRPITAFAFGLIHGFGFAGALLEVGLPAESLWVALACFNVGVECGQASIVVFIAPLIAFARARHPRFYFQLARVLSILIAMIGMIWFVARIFGSAI